MYVKNRMSANPYTIEEDAPITEVIELMRQKNLKRVPVVRGDRVVGMLTNTDIQKVSPTKATTLSIYELNYLLSKTKVSDAMSKEVISIGPDALLEEAALLMRDNKVGTLVVVEDGKLVGIITESDIFDAFIDLFGFRNAGSRITINAADVPGALADIRYSVQAPTSPISLPTGTAGRSDVIRTNAINTESIEKKLEGNGYKVIDIIHSQE